AVGGADGFRGDRLDGQLGRLDSFVCEERADPARPAPELSRRVGGGALLARRGEIPDDVVRGDSLLRGARDGDDVVTVSVADSAGERDRAQADREREDDQPGQQRKASRTTAQYQMPRRP